MHFRPERSMGEDSRTCQPASEGASVAVATETPDYTHRGYPRVMPKVKIVAKATKEKGR